MDNRDCYVDIHAHILPGIDDGSGSMEETVRMLQIASEQNIGTIIATPHYMAGSENIPVKQLREVRDKVQSEADQFSIKIYIGNELYYSESILDALKSGEALSLAGSRYILVEFSITDAYNIIYRGMGELIRAGYIPVLAHVERYVCLNKRTDLVNDLVRQGCYIQMNSGSLAGNIFNTEARINRKLVNQGLVHFMGSDCHDGKVRIPNMMNAAKALSKICDEELIHRLFIENPLNILNNTYI